MNRSAADVREFVTQLELPEVGPRFETTNLPAASFGAERELVTVGAQLTEFSAAIATELRPLIANSMLLAQLAANKATAQSTNVFDWHNKYRDVLNNIGWRTQHSEEQVHEVSNKNLGVHQAIIPVLTAMLGPAVAATSMVVSVLRGLSEMDKDNPWITLFDKSSQHASGAKFQISYIDADEHGEPSIALLACAIQAQREITQVLFFKFSSHSAELRKSTSSLVAPATRLREDQQIIAAKVQSFVADFVKNVEI